MAFDANLSGTTELADRLITLYDNEFIISAADTFTNGLPSLATIKREALAKTISFTVYSKLTVQTSGLTEDNDMTSESMADTAKTITPVEYGNVVTKTNLVQLQSGGMVEPASVRLAAINMSESIEKIMIAKGEAGSNELTVNSSGEASTTSSDIITPVFVQKAYNKLRRAGIPFLPGLGSYAAVAHDDVLYDLRAGTASNTWTDVNKYSDSTTVLRNEVGMYGGFRWFSSPLVSVNSDAGASAVDTYHTQFFGFNAFGYGESQTPGGRMSLGGKLNRFVHTGWLGTFEFALIDTDAHWLVTSASTVGANT